MLSINLSLGREQYRVDENNVLLLPFGQLIAHDISGLPNDVSYNEIGKANILEITLVQIFRFKFVNFFFLNWNVKYLGLVIDCCNDENARKTFSQCQLLIDDPPDDPVYSKHNISCMGIVRSMTSRNYSCPLYPTTFVSQN